MSAFTFMTIMSAEISHLMRYVVSSNRPIINRYLLAGNILGKNVTGAK